MVKRDKHWMSLTLEKCTSCGAEVSVWTDIDGRTYRECQHCGELLEDDKGGE